MKQLTVFSAAVNCLSVSSLSEAICLSNLNVLVLDGLSSSASCVDYLFSQSLSTSPDTYLLRHTVGGGLTSCLFNMSNLSTLHLSGNGISGTFVNHSLRSHCNDSINDDV